MIIIPPPLYILSSERSGTNLLRKRLTEYQDIYFGPSPAHFLKHLYFGAFRYGDLVEDENFKKLIDDALSLCYVHFSPWEVILMPDQIMTAYDQEMPRRSVILLTHFLMLEYARFKGFKSYICKDNYVFEFTLAIKQEIPEARFVYLVRDPRDYVLSQKNRTMITDSIIDLSKIWQYEQVKCLSCLMHLPPDDVTFLTYEDLVQDETVSMEKLCAFLGVPCLPRREVDNLNVGSTEEWVNLNQDTMTDNYEKYKVYFCAREVGCVEAVCWDEMKWHGYVPENRQRPKVSRLLKIWDSFYGRMKFLLRKVRVVLSGSFQKEQERAELLGRLHKNWRHP